MHGSAEGRADGGVPARAAEDVRVEEEGGRWQRGRRVGRRVGPVRGQGLVRRRRRDRGGRQVMLRLNGENRSFEELCALLVLVRVFSNVSLFR